MRWKSLIYHLIIIFCAACCKKEEVNPRPELPPESQYGNNTFGCLINGRAWVPESPKCRCIGRCNNIIFSISGNSFYLKAKSKYRDYFMFKCDSIYTTGTYILSHYNIASYKGVNINYFYSTDSLFTGQLNITRYDISKGIVSGTFSFTAWSYTGDSIRVTDGRFDVKN